MKDREKIDAYQPKKFPTSGIIAIAAVVAVATGIIGFVSGVQFQKATSGSSNTAQQRGGFDGANGLSGRGGMNFNGTFGEVTAVSDTSIAITETAGPRGNSSDNSGTSKTYTINDSTTITVDGNTGSASDIKTGDTVIIEASSSDSSVAASIRSGMGGPMGRQQSTTNSTDQQTRTN